MSMKFSVVSKKDGKRKTFYRLEDENGNMYFAKKYILDKENSVFMNEINALSLFSNYPFVPKIKSIDFENKMIVFDYIHGHSLREQIVDIDEAVEIILDLCDILKIIHKKGYIFGDVKPSNIMVNDRVYLVDFECLTKIGSKLNYASELYCSPYQKSDKTAIYQFDLYSLGLVFLELIIGYDKLKYIHDEGLLSEIQPNSIVLNLPIQINNIIKKLLSISVQDNYSSVIELKNDLLKYLVGC